MISKTKFGICGGQFIPEIWMPAIEALTNEDSGVGKGNFVVTRFEA
ncbi:MAG: hypothetical protein GQ567_04865 [Methanosarcinales archaeon]|nr:hypothetical protein [Methanosarcinales archaeon]